MAAAAAKPTTHDTQRETRPIAGVLDGQPEESAPAVAGVTTFVAPPSDPAPAVRTNPITELLSVVSMGATLVPNAPAEPVDNPAASALLAWARRHAEYTVDNTTAAPNTLTGPIQLAAPALALGPETPGATGIVDPTAIYNMWVYRPLNGAVQFWITSDLGMAVDGVINRISGQYLIGNGVDALADCSGPTGCDGGDAGLLFGDGGDGADGVYRCGRRRRR